MTYVTLYRKYRSKTFADLVGQQHVVRTLTNAITNGRLTHAYIFSGPRGTGKTSTARILAKSLNCRTGTSVTPCNVCDICKSISEGNSLDVIEIDAASNRGIDEMRQIRERVNYAPVEGKYKVYIIDEVHMLTEQAFNALLKTLEEPPVNTLFVLATTDPQKVPVTILSRCQRLDFGRIALPEIIAHLNTIAQSEGIDLDEKAAYLIAQNADGGLRDAISLLDQILAFSGAAVTPDDVVTILGSSTSEALFEVADSILSRNVQGLLLQLDTMVNQGRVLPQIIRDMIEFFRALLFVKLGSTQSVEMSKESIERMSAMAQQTTVQRIKEIISVLSKAELDMRWHPNARLLLEIAFIDLTLLTESGSAPAVEVEVVQNSAAVQKKSSPSGHGFVSNNEKVSAEPEIRHQKAHSPKGKVHQEPDAEEEKEKPLPEVAAPAAVAPGELSLPAVKHHWSDILQKIKSRKMRLFAYLCEAEPYKVEDGTVFLSFKDNFQFHRDQVALPENSRLVQGIFADVFGQDTKLQLVIGKPQKTSGTEGEHHELDNGGGAGGHDEETKTLLSLFEGRVL